MHDAPHTFASFGNLVAASAIAAACTGCAHHPVRPVLPWEFEARPAIGEIRVLPVIEDFEAPSVRLETYVGGEVPWTQAPIRRHRAEQLADVPQALGVALPGAVNGALGRRWSGEFEVGRFPVGGRDRVLAGLRGRTDLEAALGGVARNVGGDGALFIWVVALDGTPISAEAFPGELIRTEAGPVIVDLADEPYRVRATVGMALVAPDGDVILRYSDEFESILSQRSGAAEVGREIANTLVGEVVKVWPYDPRLAVDGDRARW